MASNESSAGTQKYGPADVTCPYCGEEVHVEAGPTKLCEIDHCGEWIIVDLEAEAAGHTNSDAICMTDGGTVEGGGSRRVQDWVIEKEGSQYDGRRVRAVEKLGGDSVRAWLSASEITVVDDGEIVPADCSLHTGRDQDGGRDAR